MTEKRKYEAPQMRTLKVGAQSIICTSGGGEPSGVRSTSTEQLQEEVYIW